MQQKEEKPEFVKWFSELNKNSIKYAGGKGANLAEIYNLKIPVPPGFVVTAQAYDYFIKKAGVKKEIQELLSNINYENTAQLEETTRKIRKLILESPFPTEMQEEILEAYETLDTKSFNFEKGSALDILNKTSEPMFVAVRSSATAEDLADASFAGQQDSFVNVKGNASLISHIKMCFASLFTSRATYYRNKKGFKHEDVSLAVVVQKMVDSDKSGVIFSKDPSTNENHIIIEAVWGLGEGVVSGKITPDKYIVSEEIEIQDKKISNKKIAITRDSSGERAIVKLKEEKAKQQVLKDYEIKKLAEIAINLEEHYKKPQDIEFAIEGEEIFIVQTRPITTLKKTSEESKQISGEIILSGMPASPGIASGKIKIIESMNDLSKIKQGDILVTKMTNPDMVITMQKSAAIVTDEGGMTCFAGDTIILTNKGFSTIKDIAKRIEEKEELWIFSYDYKNLKPKWKKIINSGSRISPIIRICTSQKGCMEGNTLDLTPDHKIVTFKNRQLIKKEINQVLNEKEMLCLVDKLPENNLINNYKLAYINGLILTDGHIKIDYYKEKNPRRGTIILTQKQTENKKEMIQTFKEYFYELFGGEFNERDKTSHSYIKGRLIQGTATDFICGSLQTSLLFNKINQNLVSWCLELDEKSCLNLLAGLIDGDGSFCNNRINLYVSKENILQGIIITCLKLGIVPQITTNRNIYNVQILERMNDILKFCKKIKVNSHEKMLGTRLFSAKQVLGDIVNDINYKGRIKPYVENNLLIDSRKIIANILPLANSDIKEELIRMLNSSTRMHRAVKLNEFGETEVFNLEVESDNEMDHNYVVFTKRYTPLLVSNSHAAIVSREMGIPAVVGTEEATTKLKEGEIITVDGFKGKIYRGKTSETTQKEVLPIEAKTRTEIKVIVDLPTFAKRASQTGIKKVGLTRIEGIIAESGKHPEFFLKEKKIDEYEEIIFQGIKGIAKYFNELWIRTSDIRSDEFGNLEGAPQEKEGNPMLGNHGIRYSLKNPEIFKAELKALKRISEQGKKIGLLLPQVISVEEVQKTKEILKKVNFMNAKVGVMIETPSSVQIIKELCDEGIDFISFGTNDLTQYILAIDRNNEKVQNLYNEMHPAILYQLSYVIRTCKRKNVETSICGQAGSRKDMVKFLVENEIDSISVNADMAKEISDYIAELEKELGEAPRQYTKKVPEIRGAEQEFAKEISEEDVEAPTFLVDETEDKENLRDEFKNINEDNINDNQNSNSSVNNLTSIPSESKENIENSEFSEEKDYLQGEEAIEATEKEKQEYIEENQIENSEEDERIEKEDNQEESISNNKQQTQYNKLSVKDNLSDSESNLEYIEKFDEEPEFKTKEEIKKYKISQEEVLDIF